MEQTHFNKVALNLVPIVSGDPEKDGRRARQPLQWAAPVQGLLCTPSPEAWCPSDGFHRYLARQRLFWGDVATPLLAASHSLQVFWLLVSCKANLL